MLYLHLTLILAAVVVNWKDRRGLALSLIVGFTLVLPVKLFTYRTLFHFVCTACDLSVGLIAYWLNTRMSNIILVLCASMCAFHVTASWFGHVGSPYHHLMVGFQIAEIAVCSIMPMLPERRKIVESDLLMSGRGLRKE